jgi:RNA polymerase sigma factor (sigma-70 family)
LKQVDLSVKLVQSPRTMTSNINDINQLEAMYAASQNRLRARLVGLGVPSTDVEDLRQEVFVVALRRRTELSNEAAAAAWLNQACEFVALAHRRKAYRRREIQTELPESEQARLLGAVTEGDPSERPAQRLHRALAALNPLERDLLALHLAADVPFRTLAELHGCDVKTVRKRFQLAAKRLRRILEAEASSETTVLKSAPWSSPGVGLGVGAVAAYRHFGADSGVSISSIGNVLITSWRGALTPSGLQLLFRGVEALRESSGQRIACLGIVEAGWPVPHFDGRLLIFQALEFLRQSCVAFGLYGEHSNLRLGEQIMRGLGFLLQVRYPISASQDLNEVAGWLLARGALELGTAEQLIEAARRTEQA